MTNKDKIEEAKHILKMIENVDKDDWERLEIIDKMLDQLIYKNSGDTTYIPQNYTESLNACQGIMLEGWILTKTYGSEYGLSRDIDKGHCLALTKFIDNEEMEFVQFSSDISTMALAWLHAIIQSMIWEWKQET